MSWYLDLSLLIAALFWASSNHQTSTAMVTLTIAYLISFSMGMVASPPDLHSVAASPVVAPSLTSTTPSSHKDCKAPDWFECHNKRCIVAAWMCDHENDCMDWSDEDYFLCKTNSTSLETFAQTPCAENEFHCAKGDSCIPARWVCDRQKDCPLGEDESEEECKGNLGSCVRITQFTCSSGECISSSWKCDGNFDCDDGSDESVELCSPGTNSTIGVNCDVERGSFLCDGGSLCLDSNQVCDSTTQCSDKSDEGNFCTKPGCDTLHCDQGCLHKPSGPNCFCKTGFTLAKDNRTCEDLDECQKFGICSQACTNTPGGYYCTCAPGYTLVNSTIESLVTPTVIMKNTLGNSASKVVSICRATSPDSLMYFATKTEVRGVNLTSQKYFSVAKGLPHVIGVGYDTLEGRVYWTDVMAGQESILSSKAMGGDVRRLVNRGLDMPEDLVVDEVSRNLYFTDSIAKCIGVCSLDVTRGCTKLISGVKQPRAVAVHHKRFLVLFTDWDKDSKKVGMVGMDGRNLTSLVSEHLGWPNGLAVDEELDRVFWSDARNDILESVRLDGTDRRVVLAGVVKHPFSLAIFEDRLFWSDWENKDIVSCNKFTGKDLKVHVKEVGVQPFGITVTNPVMARSYISPCAHQPCSHICLPSSSTSYLCLCPAHLSIMPDKRSCSEAADASLMVATSRAVFEAHPHSIGMSSFPKVAAMGDGQVAGLVTGQDGTTLVLERSTEKAIVSRVTKEGRLVKVLEAPLTSISSISYDPRSYTLFWIDLKAMGVMAENLRTGDRVTVVEGPIVPLSLLVVPEHNRLLIGQPNLLSSFILGPQANMQGISNDSLSVSTFSRPTSLAYSSKLDAVFVADHAFSAIYRLNWGSRDSLLPTAVIQNVGEVTSLAVSGDLLYWVEKDKAVLFWVTISGSREVSWISLSSISSAADVFHLAISGESLTNSDLNMACTKATCHFCMPRDEPKNSFACACPNSAQVEADGSCNVNHKVCRKESQFPCGDGQCIPQNWVCDGGADCRNRLDEANCSSISKTNVKQCDEGSQRQCANGDCLSKDWWCDGDTDCTDGSDEGPDCPELNCTEGRWRCKDEKQCVVERWRCDGDHDCRDKSDEEDCKAPTCTAEEFQCSDKSKCVRREWRCDNVPDCHDASDEVNCTFVNTCNKKDFKCSNGDCVDMALKCDGEEDCGDGSDELPQICHNESRNDSNDIPKLICAEGLQCGLQCLPYSAWCNGTWECPDYSDEKDCPQCTTDTFRCSAGNQCVPRAYLCDGEEDCSDGSDERDCRQAKVEVGCKASEFGCLNGGDCLPLERACDGLHDCLDGSDEAEVCKSACTSSLSCGPDQTCLPTPRGPACRCKKGWSLVASGLCEDIDECASLSSCAQVCTNTKGSFKCGCEEGYEVEGRNCRPLGIKHPLFLYAVGNHIKGLTSGVGGQQSVHQQLTSHSKPVASFVFDSTTGDFFWSSPGYGIIGRRNALQAKNESEASNVVWLDKLERPAQLALDWRAGNLYFSSQTSGQIVVCSTSMDTAARNCRQLLEAPSPAVTRLAIDPRAGMLFVAAHTRTRTSQPRGTIYIYTMAGKPVEGTELIEAKIGVVTGLTLDPIKQVVFWSDSTSKALRHCTYKGTNCGVIATSKQTQPNGLVLSTSKLYWTSVEQGWLNTHDILSNSTEERGFSLPAGAHSLQFSHLAQPVERFPSPCTDLGCSHICLITSPATAICACPDTFKSTLKDGKTVCSCPTGLTPTLKDHKKICLPRVTLTSFTAVPTGIVPTPRQLGPDVEPSEPTEDGGNTAAVVIVLVFVAIAILCCIFVRCKKTKSGPEVRIRFTERVYILPIVGGGDCDEHLVELHQGAERCQLADQGAANAKTHHDFVNPTYPSSAPVQTHRYENWHQGDCWVGDKPPIMDNDSAFQEPDLAVSYDSEKDAPQLSRYLSAATFKDKAKLLD